MLKSDKSEELKEEKSRMFNMVMEYNKTSGIEPELKNFIVDEQKFWSFIETTVSFSYHKAMLREHYVAIYLIKALQEEFYLSENLWFLWRDEKTIGVQLDLKLGITGANRKQPNKIEVDFFPTMKVSENAVLCFRHKNKSYAVDLTQRNFIQSIKSAILKLVLKEIKMCHMENIENYFRDKLNEIKETYPERLALSDMKALPDFDYLFSPNKKTECFPFSVLLNEKYEIPVKDIKDELVNKYIAQNAIALIEKENLSRDITKSPSANVKRL